MSAESCESLLLDLEVLGLLNVNYLAKLAEAGCVFSTFFMVADIDISMVFKLWKEFFLACYESNKLIGGTNEVMELS